MTKTNIIPTSLLIIFTVCLSFSPVSPQNNSELERVFSAAVEAVGQTKDINQIRSLEVFADCTGPKGRYTTEIASFRNNKTRFRQNFSYRDKPTDIFINEKTAWENSGKGNEFLLVSPFQKLVVHLHEYQKMAFDFQRMFHDFALEGEEVFENRPSIKVRAKNELGGLIYLYFDTKTKLLSGYVLPVPGSNETVKNVFNEWRTIGKVKLPSKVTATDNAGQWVLNFQKITLNKADEKTLEIPPRVADLAELMRFHEQQRAAHLGYNAELFVGMFAENLTQLQRGNVSTRTKAENLARVKNYFSNYKFIEWENIKPPIVKISQDGTMATIIVQKRVRGTYKNAQGEDVADGTDFAWLEVWEKTDGRWQIITVASTEKALENKP